VRRLPRAAAAAVLDGDTVRRALDAGALSPTPTTPKAPAVEQRGTDGWLACVTTATEAFMEDCDRSSPRTWSEVTTFVEQYLKPLALARLAEVGDLRSVTDAPVARIAEQVKADRGTVIKQLRRYVDRFKQPGQ
jgi:hypothetical protein